MKKTILSNTQIVKIVAILDRECKEDKCLSRKEVFAELEARDSTEGITSHKFGQLLTEAINSGKIMGYELRAGRNGGIRKVSGDSPVKSTVKKRLSDFSKSGLKPDDDKVVDFVTGLAENEEVLNTSEPTDQSAN